jgi:hypothetical protein
MKCTKIANLLFVGAMLLSAAGVALTCLRSNYEVLALGLWTAVSVWNVHSFFTNRNMMPAQFIELRKNGDQSGRVFVFWVTVALHFAGLLGVYLQTCHRLG